MSNISIQILPGIKDLLFHGLERHDNTIFMQDEQHLFLSRSCFAIEIICRNAYRKLKRPVNIWIPQYFCGETLNPLRKKDEYKLFFYPITDALLPDYNAMKQMIESERPDVFLFVHYFGNYLDVLGARNFCDEQKCVLIEDCAHVLYEDSHFGMVGDYSVFSPHKCFSIADGSVLCINKTDSIGTDDIAYINEVVGSLPRKDSRKQYVKNVIKKLMVIRSHSTYTCKEHYDEYGDPEESSKISKLSMRKLDAETSDKVSHYKEIRHRNLQSIKQIVVDAHLPVRLLNNESTNDIPYMCVLEIMDEKMADKVKGVLSGAGLPMGVWTYIPFELRNEDAVVAKRLSKMCFTIPLHQGISENEYRIAAKVYKGEE